jgi:hypothetical protein
VGGNHKNASWIDGSEGRRALHKRLIVLLIGGALMFMPVACEQEGPAEKAGEKIDETVEEAGEKMEEAGEEVSEEVEEAKEEVQESTR